MPKIQAKPIVQPHIDFSIFNLEKWHIHISKQIFKRKFIYLLGAERQKCVMDVNNPWVFVHLHCEWEARIGCLSFLFVQNILLQLWSMLPSCDMFRMQFTGNNLNAFQRDRSFHSLSVFELYVSAVCSLTQTTYEWERNNSPSESWTEVHNTYYKVMWPLRQQNKSNIVVLNIKRIRWTTVTAVPNTVSASIHMQYSQDCKDWIETEHL